MIKKWILCNTNILLKLLILIGSLIGLIWQIPEVDARQLSVLEMQNIGGGQTGCCKIAKSCDSYDGCALGGQDACLSFIIADIDDQCNDVSSGYTTCNSGTNTKCAVHRVNGDCVVDTGDADCDGNTTETLCRNGEFVTATCSGTVTWYSNGTTACP